MNGNEYIKKALRTVSGDRKAIAERFSYPIVQDLDHAAHGISTEAGELLDMVKKHIWYGKPIDWTNLLEELGDLSWYMCLAIDAARRDGQEISFEKIWKRNIAKLEERYGEKFSDEQAQNRNLDAEREILEGSGK